MRSGAVIIYKTTLISLNIIPKSNEIHLENTRLDLIFWTNLSENTYVMCNCRQPKHWWNKNSNQLHIYIQSTKILQRAIAAQLSSRNNQPKMSSTQLRSTHIPHWPYITQQPRGKNLSKNHIWKHLHWHECTSPDLHYHWHNPAKKNAYKRPTIRILGDKNKAKPDDIGMALTQHNSHYKTHNQAFNNAFSQNYSH